MIMTRHGKAEPHLRPVMFCARTENSRPPGVGPEPRPEASRGASLPRHAIVEGARNTIAPSGSSEAQRPCCSTASAVGLVQSGLSRRKGRPRNDPGCDRSVLLRLHLSEGANNIDDGRGCGQPKRWVAPLANSLLGARRVRLRGGWTATGAERALSARRSSRHQRNALTGEPDSEPQLGARGGPFPLVLGSPWVSLRDNAACPPPHRDPRRRCGRLLAPDGRG
jgi:hypothetical protein